MIKIYCDSADYKIIKKYNKYDILFLKDRKETVSYKIGDFVKLNNNSKISLDFVDL